MGADLEEDPTFFERADSFIERANEYCETIGCGKVSASLLYASLRFQAWNAACWVANGQDMRSNRQATIDYFVEQYKAMLEENLDDYIENCLSYMQNDGYD